MLSKEDFLKIIQKYNETYSLSNFAFISPKKEIMTKNDYELFIESLEYANITDNDEIALYLSTIIHETTGLTYMKEQNLKNKSIYNCKEDGDELERKWAKYNVPGQYYYGRGCIQLCWTYNYYNASLALYQNENELLENADMVSDNRWLCWMTAAWFWKNEIIEKLKNVKINFENVLETINSSELKERDNRYYSRLSKYNFVKTFF